MSDTTPEIPSSVPDAQPAPSAVEAEVPVPDAEATAEPLNRRSFVSKAAIGVAAGGLTAAAACGPGGAEEGGAPNVQTGGQRLLWRLASSFPRTVEIYNAAETLAEDLAAMTGGRFQIRVYPGGELVPPFGVMDAVQQGTVQCGHTASYYYTGKSEVLAYDTCVPFGLNPRQQLAWLTQAGGLELIHKLYADFNIINFPSGNTGGQMGGWFRREVNSVADLRGLKMRIPGIGGKVMDRLGVAVQNIPGGEIYPALERGAIDATEWVGPYDDERLGLHQAADFYYYPGWWEPCSNLTALVNLDAWNSLSSEYQAAFRVASAAAQTAMLTSYDSKNPAALERLIAGGTQFRRFSPEIMAAAKAESSEMYEEDAAADPVYREIYDHWRAFRDSSFRWFGTTELAYAEYQFQADL